MNAVDERPVSLPYSARNSLKPTSFFLDAPGANSVKLTGDFNHWQSLPMEHRDDNWWFVQVLLTHGHHRYRFLVDGKPVLDPHAAGTARDDEEKLASLIAVS